MKELWMIGFVLHAIQLVFNVMEIQKLIAQNVIIIVVMNIWLQIILVFQIALITVFLFWYKLIFFLLSTIIQYCYSQHLYIWNYQWILLSLNSMHHCNLNNLHNMIYRTISKFWNYLNNLLQKNYQSILINTSFNI